MKRLLFRISSIVIVSVLVLMGGATHAQATGPQDGLPAASMGRAFTYQGTLSAGGSPANGLYDFQFMLYNALSGGSQVGSTVAKDNETVTNGLFNVTLDFGAAFDGTGLWMEAGVRPGDSAGSYTILSPRQEITPAPYALYAQAIPLAGSGSATTASRSDHDHFGQTWNGEVSPGLTVNNTSTTSGSVGINGRSTAPNGVGGGFSASSSIGSSVGIEGWTNSPGGYGGRFGNNGGGVDIMAGGSGKIKSSADTQIVISPLNMLPGPGLAASITPNALGYVSVRTGAAGYYFTLLPTNVPSLVFGVPQKLKSIKVCYFIDNAATHIEGTYVKYTSDAGIPTSLISDTAPHMTTSGACYTNDAPTPGAIDGPLFIYFDIHDTGFLAYDIMIGNITLTLTEN